jgi:hypothetical protein
MLARDMDEQPATLQGVTVAEAADILGESTATVRRMPKRGQLEGERVLRPQGSVFVVRLPAESTHASDTAGDASSTLHETGVMPRDNASAGAQLAAWSETFLVPLVAALERSQVTVRAQAETIGRQSAEIEALRSAQVSREPSTPLRRLWARWWPSWWRWSWLWRCWWSTGEGHANYDVPATAAGPGGGTRGGLA